MYETDSLRVIRGTASTRAGNAFVSVPDCAHCSMLQSNFISNSVFLFDVDKGYFNNLVKLFYNFLSVFFNR